MAEQMVTEQYILAHTGHSSLSSIRTLSLHGLGLGSLEPSVFSKMTGLEELDISGNMLTTIPKQINLPCLLRLDCSDNKLESLSFVEQFPKLQELHTEGNGLQPADRYIAAYVCQSLNTIDRNKNKSLQKMIEIYQDKLKPEIHQVWQDLYASKYRGRIPEEQVSELVDEVSSEVKMAATSALTVLSKFQDFMIDTLVKDFIISISSEKYEYEPPVKKQKTPSKDNSPDKRKTKDRFTALKKKMATPLPHVCDFEPVHFVRCHTENKDGKGCRPSDGTSAVWSCQFEPKNPKTGERSNIVATCGGETICFINCSTGKVMKRYQQPGELFYALAWTTVTVEMDKKKWPTNIVVSGGKTGVIQLILPEQLVSYAEFSVVKGEAKEDCFISSLLVHPQKQTWIFCGGSDIHVSLWDIGVPQGADYKTSIKPLLLLHAPETGVLNMVYSVKTGHLVAGFECGCYVWHVGNHVEPRKHSAEKRHHCQQLVFPANDEDGDEEPMDGMTLLNDDTVASKFRSQGSVFIWDLSAVLKGQKRSNKETEVNPRVVLQWQETECDYLNMDAANGLLACGDSEGQIWLYNVNPLIQSKKICADEMMGPSRILPWPDCDIHSKGAKEEEMVDLVDSEGPMINFTSVSQDQKFLVACTSNNLVCIWRRLH